MERIKRFIRELSESQWLEQREFRDWEIISSTYKLPGEYDDVAPYTAGGDFDLFQVSKEQHTFFVLA